MWHPIFVLRKTSVECYFIIILCLYDAFQTAAMLPQPQTVVFCDLVGVVIAPVSKKTAVKSWIVTSIAHIMNNVDK